MSTPEQIDEAKKPRGGYQEWPGQKKKPFKNGPKDKDGKTDIQKWSEKKRAEREAGKKPTSEEVMDEMKEAIDNVMAEKPIEFGSKIREMLTARLPAAVEARKSELATTLFNKTPEDDTEELTASEEENKE